MKTLRPFLGYSLLDLSQYCADLGVAKIHATTLFRAVYKDLDFAPYNRLSLPNLLKHQLPEDFQMCSSTILESFISGYDGSVKFLVKLEDQHVIEMVLMPETKRLTLCVSTQVGCRMGCTFCRTGAMGFKRDLLPHEIVEQLMLAERWLEQNPCYLAQNRHASKMRINNVVLMGMGEPLDNVGAIIKVIEILTEQCGAGLALRRISVSTAGHLAGLQQLLAHYPKAAIAISLHEPDNELRSQLMPINRRWPITEVLKFLRDHYQRENPRASILVQYLVIKDVNDSEEHAEKIITLLRDYPVKINLIPLNEVKECEYVSPDAKKLIALRDKIHRAGLRIMVRYSKGQDIGAACGQLAGRLP